MLILASASPRRKEIFEKMGFEFAICPSDKEPETLINLDAKQQTFVSAKIKAEDIFSKNKESIVIGADTVVSINGSVLGKPKNDEDAFNMLKSLSNKRHEVITSVYVCSKEKCCGFTESTKVDFFDLTDDEIKEYLKSGEHKDKAGSYAIQGLGFRFVKGIFGDYYNVVGFPAAQFLKFLDKENIKLR